MNKTANITENMDIIDFNKNFAEFITYLVLECLGVLGGFFGNILIIGSIICTKELRSMTSLIIINLALADFILCCGVNSFSIFGNFNKSLWKSNNFF